MTVHAILCWHRIQTCIRKSFKPHHLRAQLPRSWQKGDFTLRIPYSARYLIADLRTLCSLALFVGGNNGSRFGYRWSVSKLKSISRAPNDIDATVQVRAALTAKRG